VGSVASTCLPLAFIPTERLKFHRPMKNIKWVMPLVCLFFISACKQESAPSTSTTESASNNAADASPRTVANRPMPPVIGLVKPIQLSGINTSLILEDYFMDVASIESFEASQGLDIKRSEDGKNLAIQVIGDPAFYSVLTCKTKKGTYDFLLQQSEKRKVTLRLRDDGYQKVQIKGEMNAWNPASAEMELNRGIWEHTFEVNPGDYQYLFVVDGKDIRDPKNPKTAPNGSGGINSLLSLPKPKISELPHVYGLRSSSNSITLGGERIGRLFVFWENQLLETEKNGTEYTFTLPDEAASRSRSFIRAFAQNERGVSNDMLFPLENGALVSNASQLKRTDKEAQIMYFTLVDRFNNGNRANDQPVKDDRVLPQANYQGGDIAGITQKIKDGYFQSLNINAIWLSPITQNPEGAFQEYPEPRRWYTGYHGYWPVSSSQVDDRFGTSEELRELVRVAHQNGINILLDFVCNHVHEQHPIFQQHPEWATQLDLSDGRRNLRLWDEQRLTTWFDTFLPTLDLSDPEAIEVQSDSAMFWLQEYGLDGYRHDATKHVPVAFWRGLTRKLKEDVMGPQGRSIYQIGETYGSRELIASYISAGLLDSQFDFNLYFDARGIIAQSGTDFNRLANSLQETFNYFGYHSSMGYISGNHDIPRFISLAGGALKFDENDREAGFKRDIGVGDPIGYKRLQMMHAFNMSIPGVPVIFYGDEIGIPGAGDPDNRRMMRFSGWSDNEANTKKVVAQLTQLRKDRLSLTYGETEVLLAEKDILVLARSYFNEVTIIVFNKSEQPQSVSFSLPSRFADTSLSTSFNSAVKQEGATVTVDLPAVAFDMLISK
jgi:cyclomaltodextrinase